GSRAGVLIDGYLHRLVHCDLTGEFLAKRSWSEDSRLWAEFFWSERSLGDYDRTLVLQGAAHHTKGGLGGYAKRTEDADRPTPEPRQSGQPFSHRLGRTDVSHNESLDPTTHDHHVSASQFGGTHFGDREYLGH